MSNGVNIKWLVEHRGTSIAMIETRCGKYIGGNLEEQFSSLLGAKTETFPETQDRVAGTDDDQANEKYEEEVGGISGTL